MSSPSYRVQWPLMEVQCQRFASPSLFICVFAIRYELADNVMDVFQTFTPPEARGKGLAGVLVRHVFKFCRDNKLKVSAYGCVLSMIVPTHYL